MGKYRQAEIDTAIISGGAAVVGMIIGLFSGDMILHTTLLGIALCMLIAPFQIYYASVNYLYGRNWLNMFNACACLFVSISLALGYGDITAIGGYGSVGLLSIKYWWATSRMLKHEYRNRDSDI